jgi:DNA helicase TIP49 (TBP-interacting protein)
MGKGAGSGTTRGGALVGRDGRELARIVSELDTIMERAGRLVVLLSGEPRVGKTPLAKEVVADARQRGLQVVVARCRLHASAALKSARYQ